jgi:hypothetical protein
MRSGDRSTDEAALLWVGGGSVIEFGWREL